MKAHSMRRSIWFLNIALGVAVCGVAAWYLMDVREAVANTPRPKGREAPQKWAKIVKAFNKQIEEARTDVLRAPVRNKDVTEAFKIEDYKRRDPAHFIFTGALPPPIRKEAEAASNKPAPPKGLDAVGHVGWLIWNGAEGTTVVFEFNDKTRKFFNIGDFVNRDPKAPDNRFKLTKALLPEPFLFQIEYEIWDEGKVVEAKEPHVLVWDKRPPPPSAEGIIRIVPKPKAAGTAAGPGDGDATPGGAAGEEAPGTQPGAAKPAEVIVVGGKSGLELEAKDLKPEIKIVNSRLREVRFDENSARYFKARDRKKIIESVKTREVALPGGSRGVQIVDPGEAPAEVFDLRRGDVVISINGQLTPDRASIIRVAESIPETAIRVTIVVDRNSRKITFNVDPRDPKTRRNAARYGHR